MAALYNRFRRLFAIMDSCTLTTLHAFEQTDGEVPLGPLVQGSDGNLYGVTGYGGINCGPKGGGWADPERR